MMNLIRQYRTALSFIAVVAVLFLGYQYFFAQPNTDVVSVETNPDVSSDQDLVALLFELKSIRLDNTIFQDPLFQSLHDFGQGLVQEPVGRQNPFAPFGGGAPTPPKTPAPPKSAH